MHLHHLLEPRRRLAGAVLLDEAEPHTQHDHHRDDDRRTDVRQQPRRDGKPEQQAIEWRPQTPPDFADQRILCFLGYSIGAIGA